MQQKLQVRQVDGLSVCANSWQCQRWYIFLCHLRIFITGNMTELTI